MIKFSFAFVILLLFVAFFSLLTNHQGLTSKLFDIIFILLAIGTAVYVVKVKK